MTIDRVAMKELLEKGSDQDLLREMLAFVAARMMDVEVESLTGAAHGERSAERTNQRNGYRTREWHTGVGTVPVAIPKLRKSTYFPSFLEPRRSADKAMIAVIQEAYVHGVSTRSVDDLVKAMGMTGISKSQVSRLCGRSTAASRSSSTGRSKAPGPTCGSTPLTSRCVKAAGSSRSRR